MHEMHKWIQENASELAAMQQLMDSFWAWGHPDHIPCDLSGMARELVVRSGEVGEAFR